MACSQRFSSALRMLTGGFRAAIGFDAQAGSRRAGKIVRFEQFVDTAKVRDAMSLPHSA